MAQNGRLPRDISLLRLQHEHITYDLWEGRERVLRPRRAGVCILNNQDILDPRVVNLIQRTGFGHALYIPDMDVNHFLISSLLERWRSETHTFHFPHGETTVTLEDVVVLLGLPIDGDVVTCPTNMLFILQYDMSQEPSQPASQPYIGHVGSSPDFIHHP